MGGFLFEDRDDTASWLGLMAASAPDSIKTVINILSIQWNDVL
jgi:hypothetical protein